MTCESTRKAAVDPTTLARARELRRQMTVAERRLWYALRGKKLHNLRFRRQHPIPPYICDFYCHEHRLAIELDGGQHNEAQNTAYDRERALWLQSQDVRVIRFWNHEVMANLDGVLNAIAQACNIELA